MQIVLGRVHIEAVNGTVPSQLRLTSRCSPEVESSRTQKSLASKVKSLASGPQVLENWPVLGSSTALFLNCWNFVDRLKKNFRRRFLLENAWKKILKTFFFLENTCACVIHPWPWPRAFLSLASIGLSSARLSLALASDFFCALGLEPCVLDSNCGVHTENFCVDELMKVIFLISWYLLRELKWFVTYGSNFEDFFLGRYKLWATITKNRR